MRCHLNTIVIGFAVLLSSLSPLTGSHGAAPNAPDEQPLVFPYTVTAGEKQGLMDRSGKVILAPSYLIGQYSEGLYVIELDGKVGYMNAAGKVVIEPQYRDAVPFHEGLARVSLGLEYHHAYIDKSNQIIIPNMRTSADFIDGRVQVYVNDKGYGYMDRTGKMVIEPKWDRAEAFAHGVACVRDNSGKWGYIDRDGKIVIAPQFSNAAAFNESGYARIEIDSIPHLIDRTGKVHPEFDYSGMDFQDGLIAVDRPDTGRAYLDNTGKVVIPPFQSEGIYGQLSVDFHDGRAPIRKDNKVGFIDRTGKVVIEPKYTDAFDFSEGKAIVRMAESYSVIDTDGKVLGTMTPTPNVQTFRPFKGGLAVFQVDTLKDGPLGLMDGTGRIVLPPTCSTIVQLEGGISYVYSPTFTGYLDKDMKVIWKK